VSFRKIISGDNPQPARGLGVYLVCVGTYELGLTAWTQISRGDSLFWSRSGLFGILELLESLNVEDLKLWVYYAVGCWLIGLGIAMTMGRAPLKTYLAGEIIMDLPTLYLIVAMLKDFTTLKLLALPAVFLLESVIPSTWAVILLWRKWRLRRLQTPPTTVPGIKSLGIYLLIVSLFEFMFVVGCLCPFANPSINPTSRGTECGAHGM